MGSGQLSAGRPGDPIRAPSGADCQWRFPYDLKSTLRTLFWGDRNLLFHRYELCPPSRSLETLLAELDRDPTGIF